MNKYKPSDLENKWQKIWDQDKIYSPHLTQAKRPFYNLMMFPYPSAEGLHVGNMYAFTGADIYGRFKRMQGYDVFEPIGLDGFGIHSENYAIKVGRHPKEHAKISEENFYRQLKQIGNGFAWDYRLETYEPDYYRWTQWLFIQMFKAGLAYKGKAMVNWCPSCKTVLADEQVVGEGVCERCGTKVEKREMSSWFFKITKYSDRLLSNIEKIEWPEKIKTAQRNWIGKSEGMTITFKTENGENLEVFTTRADTLNAVTFIAIADEDLHAKGDKEKIGEFTGRYAIEPLEGRKIPIWKTNYVASGYGTGVVMGVPAHDERDMDFAKKYGLEIVNKKPDKTLWKTIEDKGWGKKTIHYHLRDWLISRQRYWGPPIPMIHCKDCGWQPVPEKDLPVLLPDIEDFKPKGDGTSPLHNAPDSWKKVSCPNCGKVAERELDVSDTFLDSAWYFLRYPSVDYTKGPFDPEITKRWLPVNAYIGGAEHAVLHLLYARFVWMMLTDNGFLSKDLGDEPFPFLFGHGLIIKDGAKMSKSRGNVVNPDEYIKKYGADTLRMYLMFLGPYDAGGDFRDTGIEGMDRFLKRVVVLYQKKTKPTKEDLMVVCFKTHKVIKKVTEEVEKLKYNTSIAAIMELVNLIGEKGADKKILSALTRLLAPFAPYIAEEIWHEVLKQEGSVHTATWPEWDEKYIKSTEARIAIQVNGKLRSQITVGDKESLDKEKVENLAKLDSKVAKWLEGKKVLKVVFVPGKIINFVVK